MATAAVLEPKSLVRPTHWSKEVENAYRFQLAGYRDELEYKRVRQVAEIDIWPDSGFVKKLQRRKDGFFYYFDKLRECPDKEINKCTDQLQILSEQMVTSEYSFSCEPIRRVPMNSATTHKDWTEYNSYGTMSTYSYWSRPMKPTVKTRYIDGTTLLSQYDCVYSMKDLFPKGKGRQKPFNPSNKKDAREAYMSLLPVDVTTVRAKTTQNPGLPQVKPKSADLPDKRSCRSTIFDDHSQSKLHTQCSTTNTSVGWVRRYKSINESQILSEILRDPSYENGISIKRRPCQQLFVSSSASSFNKRRREKC